MDNRNLVKKKIKIIFKKVNKIFKQIIDWKNQVHNFIKIMNSLIIKREIKLKALIITI